MNAIYEVRYVSLTDFPSSGDYVYGLTQELNKETEGFTAQGKRWHETISRHRSMETAMCAATKHLKRNRAAAPPSEPFPIGLREAGKVQTMRDQEMVLGIEKGLF